MAQLSTDLSTSDTFRKVYNFTFDYAKTEGQKGMRRCPSSVK